VTPKEKAKELVSKFNFDHTGETYILHQTVDESKRCALIAVDELLTLITYQPSIDYYLEVKQEIQEL
jgi:hypothetical protein